MARLVPGLARVVGVDTGQLYSLARDAEGGVLGVQGLLIRAALRTWQALCSSLPPASWPTGRGRQHRGQQGRQGPLQQAHQQAQGNKSEGNIYCIFAFSHLLHLLHPGKIWVKSFSLPDLHIVKPTTQTQISISDHEGVASHIYLWKQ